MMQRSWAENLEQPLLYTAEFLESCFQYPGASYALAPTLYQQSKPVAFVAGFPRRVRFKERDLSLLLITFLTVANEYKRAGYGILIWVELVKRAQAAGYDGLVNYCVDGSAMNRMITGCCQTLKLPTERILSVRYQMRLLQPKPGAQDQPREDPESVQALLQSAARIADQLPMARIWTVEEAKWQCSRQGAVVIRHVSGSRRGMLTGYLMDIANSQRTKCLLVDDVLWGTLEQEEQQLLVRKLLDHALQAGAQMAIVPCQGYADVGPFRAVRFRASPRVVHTYLTIFSGKPTPAPVSSLYLDIV